MIEVQHLSKRYGPVTAVNDVSFRVEKGEILGFLGPNGAGKTSTMRIITGYMPATEGKATVAGFDVFDKPIEAKKRTGYLPETPPLYRELTVREYIDLAARLHRVPKSERHAAVDAAMAGCGLTGVAKKLVGTLSKGYQQRVGIAQAIVHKPDIVILDEPTVGLDPNQIRDIRNLIRELGRERSVILSTHILPEVESVCDRVLILHHGRTVFGDTIDGLKKFHGGRIVHVGLRNPPAIAELRSIPGVAGAEAEGTQIFRISFADQSDPTDALVRHAVEKSWGLFQLVPAQTSVEEVFVQLTKKDEASA